MHLLNRSDVSRVPTIRAYDHGQAIGRSMMRRAGAMAARCDDFVGETAISLSSGCLASQEFTVRVVQIQSSRGRYWSVVTAVRAVPCSLLLQPWHVSDGGPEAGPIDMGLDAVCCLSHVSVFVPSLDP